jgi:hypothetical protein
MKLGVTEHFDEDVLRKYAFALTSTIEFKIKCDPERAQELRRI